MSCSQTIFFYYLWIFLVGKMIRGCALPLELKRKGAFDSLSSSIAMAFIENKSVLGVVCQRQRRTFFQRCRLYGGSDFDDQVLRNYAAIFIPSLPYDVNGPVDHHTQF
jgi:hypothetical protein